MDRANDKKQDLYIYIVDMLSVMLSYVLAGCVWILVYKKMDNLSSLNGLLKQELVTLLVSYVIIIFLFKINF